VNVRKKKTPLSIGAGLFLLAIGGFSSRPPGTQNRKMKKGGPDATSDNRNDDKNGGKRETARAREKTFQTTRRKKWNDRTNKRRTPRVKQRKIKNPQLSQE